MRQAVGQDLMGMRQATDSDGDETGNTNTSHRI